MSTRAMRDACRILVVTCLGILPGLVSAQDYYLVEDLAAQAVDPGIRAEAREIEEIHAALAAEAGVSARLVYSNDPDINAYATEVGGERVIVVQEGLLRLLRADRDAVAAVLGHELAHHRADHVREGRRKQQQTRAFGSVLGVLVGAAVGHEHGELAGSVSQAAVGVGAEMAALKFSRTQELEADRLSVEWMLAAGFDPAGMIRLQQRLAELSGRRNGGIFATHPNSRKRTQAVERQLAAMPGARQQSEPAPLVTAADREAAELAIASEAQGADPAPAARDAGRPAAAIRGSDNVHIGRSVTVGENVRIGSEPEPED
jgi:predicted Zn-dependent protease